MSRSFKFFIGFIVHGLTLAVVLAAAGFWFVSEEFRKAGPLTESAYIEIGRGSGLSGIAEELKESGAIENTYVFVAGTRILGAQSQLKAGEYELTPGMSPRDIMEKIRKGDVYDRRFTVREGLTSYEVVQILKGINELEGDIAAIPEEGSLLPQTYDYRRHETRAEIIARMQKDMARTIDELWAQRAADLPFSTPQEAVTLASIVEKETGVESERKRVAGVFINRLRRGIALQSDPTVIYALTSGQPENEGLGPLGRRLLRKDLEMDSPYNTYKHPGLPPGPIANPGRASIEAVLNPEAHDFIYFVADGSGGHVFAATLAEHNSNVANWQKIRREKEK